MLPGLVRARNHLVYFFNPAFQEPVKGPFKKIVTRETGWGSLIKYNVSDGGIWMRASTLSSQIIWASLKPMSYE